MCRVIYAVLILQSSFSLLKAQSGNTTAQVNMSNAESTLSGSQIAAVIASCLVGAAVILAVVLFFMIVKIREKRQMEGSFSPRGVEQAGPSCSESGSMKLPRLERLV